MSNEYFDIGMLVKLGRKVKINQKELKINFDKSYTLLNIPVLMKIWEWKRQHFEPSLYD